jgi:hypothetical protein
MRTFDKALYWGDTNAIDHIDKRLERQMGTVLYLPFEYHPPLSAHLDPRARVRPRIYTCGDAELLRRIVRIPGLQALATLVPRMKESGARLRVVSPAPQLVFNVPRFSPVRVPMPSITREGVVAHERSLRG